MGRADLSNPRGFRLGIAVAILALHVLAILGLVRAFAPTFTESMVESVTSAFTVTVPTTQPTPEPEPEAASKAPEEQGAAGEAGKNAKPREVAAPEPKIVIAEKPAPKAASTGNANSSGAREAGQGTGAGGQGEGTGAGGSGSGHGGGGGVAKAVKIAGDINSARDYPRKSRNLRIDDYVIVALTVATDGSVKGCRVHRPSKDAEADAITCRLAKERFRFRPATDAQGRPVESVYGWKQTWFYAGKK